MVTLKIILTLQVKKFFFLILVFLSSLQNAYFNQFSKTNVVGAQSFLEFIKN